MKQPHLIGIAGGSCSGKTTFACRLAEQLDVPTSILPIDAYYRDLSLYTPEERAGWNFDAPEAIEHSLLLRDITCLANGEGIDRPEYDFTRHVRSTVTVHVEPSDYILLEGLFALYWESVRELLQTKLFIDVPDALSLSRRMERDVRERGRTEASVLQQYEETVRPMYLQYCASTRPYADLVLLGNDSLEHAVDQTLQLLGQSPKGDA